MNKVVNKIIAVFLGGCAGAMFSNLFTKSIQSMIICSVIGAIFYYFVISKSNE